MGAYLYGFTGRAYQPAPELRGLAGASLCLITVGDLAAVVSPLAVQRLMPSRSNVEPHHRVVRQISGETAMVPAAFGHITESEADIAGVIRANYGDIRAELDRLAFKCEMGLKARWSVENIFGLMVRTDGELRRLRDEVFGRPGASMNDKLQVGAAFEASLNRQRERLTAAVLGALRDVTRGVFQGPPHDEKTICNLALLVNRFEMEAFDEAVKCAAVVLDEHCALQCSGPWPPYSFVRLRLQPSEAEASV